MLSPLALVMMAKVKRPHGLKGELKLEHYAQDWQNLKRYSVYILNDDRELHLDRVRRGRNDHEVIASFTEIRDRNQSEALVGQELSVKETALPELDAQEYYHHQLIGIAAQGESGETLGKISAVHNFGAGDMLEITPEENHSFLHPFKPEFVQAIDMEAKSCVLLNLMDQE